MSEIIETNATPSDLQPLSTSSDLQPLIEDDEDVEFTSLPPDLASRRQRRVWQITLTIIILLALVGGGAFIYAQRNRPTPVQYTQQAATTGNLTISVSATGPLAPNATYNMNFSAQGTISEIDVHIGQRVSKGQVLAKVNSPSLQDAVTQAQQTVNNAQTTYDDAVNNGASQTTLDQDLGQLQSAQDQLKTAQDNLAATVMTAPGNATVAAINGVVGDAAGSTGSSSSSSTTSSSFITLVDTSSSTITALVNEADISNVQPGQPVAFTVEAYATRTFRATVSSVSMVGQTSSNVVSYPVVLSVTMSSLTGAHLYPGMTATASIVTVQHTGALLIPNAALSFPTTAIQAGVINTSSLIGARRNPGGFGGFGGGGQGTGTGQGRGSGQGTGTGQGRGNGQGTGTSTGQGGSAGTGTGQTSRRVILELRNGVLTPVIITVGLSNGTFTEVLSGLQAGDQVVTGATGGAFSNLSSSSSSTTNGALFRGAGGGGFGGGGAGGGGTRGGGTGGGGTGGSGGSTSGAGGN